jgi:hypothetical protein
VSSHATFNHVKIIHEKPKTDQKVCNIDHAKGSSFFITETTSSVSNIEIDFSSLADGAYLTAFVWSVKKFQ